MNDLATTRSAANASAPDVPTPPAAQASPDAHGFSLEGFLGGLAPEASTASAGPESRTVTGGGKFVYEQFRDGTVTIVGGPANVGKSYPPGHRVNAAITAEINKTYGPFPSAPKPATGGKADAPAPSAPPDAVPSLDRILAGVGEIGTAIGDTIGAIGDAIGGAVGGLFGGSSEAPDTAEPAAKAPEPAAKAQEPAAKAQEPETPEASGAASHGSFEYLSQRDNKFNKGGVFGDVMCTVTSVSMQLIALCGSADAVKQETAALLTAKGGTPPAGAELAAAQTEDVLMTFFDLLAQQGYWDAFAKSTTPPFYKNWMNDVADGKFHQSGVCQTHVLSMYKGITSSNVSRLASKRATIQEFLEKDIKPEMDKGVTYAMSTLLTSGHFVTLIKVLPDGILIHDPYGAKTSAGHLKNGRKAKERSLNKGSLAELKVRFRENPALLTAIDDPQSELPNWGESNYFTWPEVEKWKIGGWGTAASKAP